jgi:hypothetical protein
VLTIEAPGGPLPVRERAAFDYAWVLDDDRGNRYTGMDTGGWSGPNNGAHVAFAPRLDPQARELRLSFFDPFGRAGHLTALVPVPQDST